MHVIRNVFAIIGLLAVIAITTALVRFGPIYEGIKGLDPKAGETYLTMAKQLVESGSSAEATVWKFAVKEGISADEVEETMKFVANEHNIMNVGELPLYKQVEAMSGKPYRVVKIFMFCNALTAAMMIDYDPAMSAYLPCRITLVEDQKGKLWLYSLNMDLMIHGGRSLPPELNAEAVKVKEIILDIMQRGASGDF